MNSSTLKRYFNAAAEGNMEVLSKCVSMDERIIKCTNRNTDNTAIYYSVKNLKLEATKYLMDHGLKMSHRDIHKLIALKWYGKLESYKFMIELGEGLFNNGIQNIDFETWISNKYMYTYFSNGDLEKLEMFVEYKTNKPNWDQIIEQYISFSSNSNNKLQFLRGLKLKTLV